VALRLGAIQDLSREITLSPGVGQAAETVVDFVARVLDFHNCGLMIRDDEQDELYTLAARGIGKEMAPRLPMDGAGITVAAFRTGERVYVPRVDDDERYVPIAPEVASEVAVPLVVDGDVLGVLNVESSQPDPFAAGDLRLLSALADQTAVAIKNAQLHEQAQAEISHRRTVEVELREAKEKAEAANKAKSEFLARMSHEIRTPIHGIRGVTDLLDETELSQEQRQYLNLIRDSTLSLSTVVNDILDFSKIEAGRMEVETAPFDLRAVAEEATSLLAPRARDKGLELVCRIPPDMPTAVLGDRAKLREVLVNLVDNAVKFTHDGEVVVSVDAPAVGDEVVETSIAVRDTGIGIAEEKQQAIFEAFHQADISTTREYGGTGLGLTIAERLTRLMGGQISLESSEGEGSTFRVDVPLERDPAERDDGNPFYLADGDEPVEVLVIDDHEATQQMLREQITDWGAVVTEAAAPDAALEVIDEATENWHPFHVVLMDAGRTNGGDLNGLEDVRRHLGPSQLLVPMLSSRDIHSDVERCHELGLSDYLVKPIEYAPLRALFEDVVQSDGEVESTTKPDGRRAASGLTILLVEDNRAAQLVGKKTLQAAGHSVVVVGHGEEALEEAQQRPFDLILMDIEMPQMDGLEVIKSIRDWEAGGGGGRSEAGGERVPIVAISAYATEVDREKSLAAGADDFLSKPISPAALEAWIHEFFSEKETFQDESVVDLDAALESTAGDRSLLAEAASVFVDEDYPRHRQTLQDALDREDADGVAKAAHGIAGPVESFGGRAVARVASELTEMARGGDLAGALSAVETLDEEVERFRAFYVDLEAEG
jgi:signal transduction histidine kinase/CheY-like chemotaxis protein